MEILLAKKDDRERDTIYFAKLIESSGKYCFDWEKNGAAFEGKESETT